MAYRRIRTTARIQFTTHVQVQSIIIHNQIQCIVPSHSVSSSQVSLYGPPLNQLCQDDLPRTSNIPLYQSQVPFSGVHLLNHARMTYTSTMKCPARYPALYILGVCTPPITASLVKGSAGTFTGCVCDCIGKGVGRSGGLTLSLSAGFGNGLTRCFHYRRR